MRGEAAMFAATAPPPPPPAGFELPDLSKAYAPPKAYEAGDSIFDLSRLLHQGQYVRPREPPPPPPPELEHLQGVCLRAGRRRKAGGGSAAEEWGRDGGGGGGRGRRGGLGSGGGMQVLGLGEDEVLVVSGGGRFESAPERSALLEQRLVALLRRARGTMAEAYDEISGFEVLLHACKREHPQMNQYVDKRLPTLCLYTDKELKKWFASSGYDMPSYNKTDERQKSRRLRDEGVARLQLHMQRLHYQLMLGVAQRCTGWSQS